MTVRILTGDCRTLLASLDAGSVQTCVTSPPYFGLRDYGVAGQIGLEATPDAFVAELVAVFREVRRVLRDDGTLWLNLGDSYVAKPNGNTDTASSTLTTRRDGTRKRDVAATGRLGGTGNKGNAASDLLSAPHRGKVAGLKPKDLIGIPWRVAFALQADGWYLRSDIIWHKPNPMPESVVDRPTKAHEYLFLLTKESSYYYDADAIREPLAPASVERLTQPTLAEQEGSHRVPGKTNGAMKAVPPRRSGNKERKFRAEHGGNPDLPNAHQGFGVPWTDDGTGRNRRSVWTVTTQPFKGAHFATFPPALIEPCILAGSRPGDLVLDPFGGAGTTGLVADRLGRDAVLIELNPDYAAMARARVHDDAPLFSDGAA